MSVAATTGPLDATQAPYGWNVVHLGDVAEVAFSSVDKKTVEGEIPVRLCNYTDVFYNRRVCIDMPFMEATARPTECQRWALRKGDVLFTKDSETVDEIGVPAYVASDMPDVLCGYHLGLARPIHTSLDGAFLARALASQAAAREFSRIANGITRFGLTLDATRALTLLLPPLSEQRAIAAVLDSIDEAIERTDEVIAATERLRDALLHELLTRGLPGQHSEWKVVPGLGTIPVSWKAVRLGDVAEVRSGQVDPRDPELQHLQFVAPDDIESATGRLILRRRVSDAGAISGKYEFDEQYVIYSKIRPYLMKVYLPKNRGLCSADMYPIRPRRGLTRGYLALVLVSPSFTDYARTCSDRTGIPKINRTDLLQFQLRLPSLSEQRAIGAVLDSVDSAIEQTRDENTALHLLQTSTADALLTGRIRAMAC